MSGKGWFGSRDVVLHSGEGPIYTVKWHENFIAWANEAVCNDFLYNFLYLCLYHDNKGVKIFDVISSQKFAYIDRPPSSPRADLFRCNLCWKSIDTLLIGWADSVKVGIIKERDRMDLASGLPSHYVEIVCQLSFKKIELSSP